MKSILTRLMPARETAPVSLPTLPSVSDRDGAHREIAALALRDVLRKFGVPPTWITANPQVSTTARRGRGIHLHLTVREWQPQATAPGALAQIAAPLLRTVLEFSETGFGPLATRFAQRDALRGREVQLSDGTAGRCEGVGWTGELLVHTAAGMQSITSSEVSVRPRAG